MTWRRDADCLNENTDLYYQALDDDLAEYDDVYDRELARELDKNCLRCPITKRCFAEAVSNKEWGIWGSVYFEEGAISERYNTHKVNDDWIDTWMKITN